ncbi:MerR family transcriptional regulator [Actinomycetospora straminea]|uniref:HTH merR-type domain-containing protein n=1 Tax=Actinomycetospora straminea TaxID=663607 RepID=A0ABP9EUN2_9PSEU|nr:MerR family transcriptional regulator [Actinomycetospora straminea]MDD7934824.1 MerR family transcriptional regulator [Actinomycetospora straminea]
MGVEQLDDQDYPSLTIGQAADLIGVAPAFLRSLDAADLLHPQRSEGGQRRYSRRQVDFAARVRALSDEGHTIAGAASILTLRGDLADAQRDLAAARAERDEARAERDEARADLARAHDALDELRAE